MKTSFIHHILLLSSITLLAVSNVAFSADAHGNHQPTSASKASQTYTTTGKIDGVHPADKKVTIAHQPIAALGWPAMTMRFAVKDISLLNGLKKGDRVRLDFYNQGNVSIITDIEVIK